MYLHDSTPVAFYVAKCSVHSAQIWRFSYARRMIGSMNNYDAITNWYEIEHRNFLDDLEMYRNYAERCGNPILEVGCGNGRLLVPLTRDGFEMTGIDLSPTMLDRCRQHLEEDDLLDLVHLVQADMTAFNLPDHDYHLAYIALGTFQHIAALDQRRSVLNTIRRHVTAGATLLIDLAQDEAARCLQLADSGSIAHIATRFDSQTQQSVTHTMAAAFSHLPATATLTHWYDVYPQNGPVTRTCMETTITAISRAEIDLLLPATGWHIRHIFGDYALGEWDEHSPRLIVEVQAAEV